MLLQKILLGSINVSLIPHPCSPTETEGYIAGRCKRIRRTMVKNILSEFSDHARSSVVDPEAEGGGGKGANWPSSPPGHRAKRICGGKFRKLCSF